jgi:hypothetical protein
MKKSTYLPHHTQPITPTYPTKPGHSEPAPTRQHNLQHRKTQCFGLENTEFGKQLSCSMLQEKVEGLVSTMSMFSTILFFTLPNMSLLGTSSFIWEFLILERAFQRNSWSHEEHLG